MQVKHPGTNIMRLDSNIESKSSNNTYLNIIKIFNKLLLFTATAASAAIVAVKSDRERDFFSS